VSVLAAAALTAWGWLWIRLDPGQLVAGPVLRRLGEMAAAALPPALPAGGWEPLASATVDTLAMSVLAAAIASTGAALLAFPAARLGGSWARRGGALLARALLLVLRAVPPPVWALVCLFVLFPGILPGAVALGLYNLGIVGRLMAEAAENLDRRPAERLRAAGATAGQAFLYATAPAAAGRFAAYALYRWEVAVRETLVVGAVGAGGLGLLLARQLAQFDVAAALTTILATIALTFAVDMASTALRQRLR
jgi:phosphonate transport system permease protein